MRRPATTLIRLITTHWNIFVEEQVSREYRHVQSLNETDALLFKKFNEVLELF